MPASSKPVRTKHLHIISNGLGGPSMAQLILAAQKKVPSCISITADTGWENDRLMVETPVSDGTRMTAAEYYQRIVLPYCQAHGIEAHFVRAADKRGRMMPTLWQHTLEMIEKGKLSHIKIPLFGSDGGRLRQACTSRWKIAGINQCARDLGAKTAVFYQAIVMDEVPRRIKGINPIKHGRFTVYDQIERRVKYLDDNGHLQERLVIRKWAKVCYPLVDLRMFRRDAAQVCIAAGVPYLITSECDGCPHQDIDRWDRHTPEVLHQIAKAEARMDGQFFFTDARVPLLEALPILRDRKRSEWAIDFGCESGGVCGV